MSNNGTQALVVREATARAISEATGFQQAMIQVVKESLFKGDGDDADLWLFLTTAKRWNADPLKKEIHAVFRWDSKASKKVMAIQIGIDHLRKLGKRTPGFRGMAGPYWKAKGEPWTDLWEEEGPPYAAKVGIWLRDCPEPIWGVVKWDEFAQYRNDKDGRRHLIQQWAQMPSNQLAKCAEAQAWRKVMPDADDLRIGEEVPAEEELGQTHASEMAARDEAYYEPGHAASKRFHTVKPEPTIVNPQDPTEAEYEAITEDAEGEGGPPESDIEPEAWVAMWLEEIRAQDPCSLKGKGDHIQAAMTALEGGGMPTAAIVPLVARLNKVITNREPTGKLTIWDIIDNRLLTALEGADEEALAMLARTAEG